MDDLWQTGSFHSTRSCGRGSGARPTPSAFQPRAGSRHSRRAAPGRRGAPRLEGTCRAARGARRPCTARAHTSGSASRSRYFRELDGSATQRSGHRRLPAVEHIWARPCATCPCSPARNGSIDPRPTRGGPEHEARHFRRVPLRQPDVRGLRQLPVGPRAPQERPRGRRHQGRVRHRVAGRRQAGCLPPHDQRQRQRHECR